MPSDVAGILSIDFSDNVSEGFMKIEDELKRVGVIKAGAGEARRQEARRRLSLPHAGIFAARRRSSLRRR